MALTYERLNQNTDVTTTRTLLHEIIPLTGTIVSGTYGTFPDEENIKNYTHGMFQSVYDYPYLSSSANHIFDLTVGYDETSELSGTTSAQNKKKINIYNQFSQVLLGYSASTNTTEIFESDLDITDNTAGKQMKTCMFISFTRLITKDQIKKGSFSITLGQGAWGTPFNTQVVLQDLQATVDGTQVGTCVGGEYGVLFDATASLSSETPSSSYGVVFYQAGIVALSASAIWAGLADFAKDDGLGSGTSRTVDYMQATASISASCDALRHRVGNLSYNNTTEINSTIYFCRVPVNKFNYSSNPTYTTGSKIRVKNVASDEPVAYVTTIGLYNASNELLATAKVSEPLRKDPTNELTLRVRLDY